MKWKSNFEFTRAAFWNKNDIFPPIKGNFFTITKWKEPNTSKNQEELYELYNIKIHLSKKKRFAICKEHKREAVKVYDNN